MGVETISSSNYEDLLRAVDDVIADPVHRARSGLDPDLLQEIRDRVNAASEGNDSNLWERVHHDREFLPSVLNTYIFARTEAFFGNTLLSVLLRQHVEQLQATQPGSVLGEEAEIFSFIHMPSLDGGESLAKARVTFQLGGGAATYRSSDKWGTHEVPLHYRDKGEMFKLRISSSVEDLPLVIVGLEAVGAFKEGFKGTIPEEVDIRLDHVPVPFEQTRSVSGITLDHMFAMEPNALSRILSVKAFGEMSTVAFLHSARAFGVGRL